MTATEQVLGIAALAAMAACAPVRVAGPAALRLPAAADEAARTIELPELRIRVVVGDVNPILRAGEAGIQGATPDGHMSAEIVRDRVGFFFSCWNGLTVFTCRTEHSSVDEFRNLSGLFVQDDGLFRSVMEGRVANDPHEGGYAALQSTWRDPEGGTIHAWYHAEVFVRDSSLCAAYASIGYATSEDHGLSFQKRAVVLTSPYPQDDSACLGQGVQGPEVLEAENSLYMFFTMDHPQIVDFRGIGLARASKAEPRVWHKYHAGAFSQPGIGGHATPVIPRGGRNAGIWNASVSWNTYLRKYLMLHSDFANEGAVYLRLSDDLITWSDPALVIPASAEYGYRYPTLFGELDDVTHQEGWLYFGRTRQGQQIGPDTLMARRRFRIERDSRQDQDRR